MTSLPDTHAAFDSLEFDDDVLVWGGTRLTDVVTDIGQTPLYLYDRARMSNRVSTLRSQLPDAISVHYAMKANPFPDVVNHMASIVDGLDVASSGEMDIALASSMAPNDISFAGPGKRPGEIEAAISAGITLNAESPTEIDRIIETANTLGTRPRVAIRVNPDFELKSSGMKMGGYPSQFGIDAEKAPSVLATLASADVEFRGFHIYSGSQNLRAEAIIESITKTVDLIVELAGHSGMAIPSVNLGGGLGIPYFPNEKYLDVEAVGEGIDAPMQKLLQALDSPEVVLEMGRYLVGEAGIYVTKVVDVKDSRGTCYAVCDGGLHHHLAASGNFGQVLRKNYPVLIGNRATQGTLINTNVVGPLCTPLDLIGHKVDLPEVRIGDLIVVLQSGAYGATASPINFLSQPGFVERLI